MKSLFQYDYYQLRGRIFFWGGVLRDFLKEPSVRYLYFQRKYDASTGIVGRICWLFSRIIGKKYGLEIYTKNIGKYLYLGHIYRITVNSKAVLGNCISLHKGGGVRLVRTTEARERTVLFLVTVYGLESMQHL